MSVRQGDTPGDRPKLAFTVFQSSDSFVTYDHQAGAKTVWRTAMLENLERDYFFIRDNCAFYSRPDEKRVIDFCKPYVTTSLCKTGFSILSKMQQQLRDKETLQRQKNRERKIRARLSGLNPLPCDLEDWLRCKVLPAYFFYDYRKGAKSVQGLCSACGQTVELIGVRHNAKGMCPHCGRELTIKSNGKRGYLYCKNLGRALKGTPWQYCQLREFYEGIQDEIEVAPYLTSYSKVPAIEFFVKLKLFWPAAHVIYRRDGEKDINLHGKNLKEVLQIDPSDLPCLQKPGVGIRELRLLRILRAAGHQPSEELFTWVKMNELTEMDQLTCALNNTTPHKLMRYLNQLFSKLGKDTYRGCAGVLSDYSDYLGFCEQHNANWTAPASPSTSQRTPLQRTAAGP